MYLYCTSNTLLVPCNSGFKRGDSAVNQLLHITNNIYQGFDAGCNTAMVLLDLKAAFDSVWHDGLIAKLVRLGKL